MTETTKLTQPYTACVLGATGATGSVLLSKLVRNPLVTSITCLQRRVVELSSLGITAPEQQAKIRQVVVDFEHLNSSLSAFQQHTVAFCCLGSTRRDAGSNAAFRHIDFDYVSQCARLLKSGGTKVFQLQSSVGADANSFFNYCKVKGEIENELRSYNFTHLSVFRPGVLLTPRPNSFRPFEWVAQRVLPLFHFALPEQHCAVYTATVAEAMSLNAQHVLAQIQVDKQHRNEGKIHHDTWQDEDEQAIQLASNYAVFENEHIRNMQVFAL